MTQLRWCTYILYLDIALDRVSSEERAWLKVGPEQRGELVPFGTQATQLGCF